ncbi:MAG: LysM peptidoglycan-binding domain-containing protein [Syntrophobacterales bacterium]|nr:LysM peptidoglycan-binding domain-containing protein [Syntrophobacterales bacterium]
MVRFGLFGFALYLIFSLSCPCPLEAAVTSQQADRVNLAVLFQRENATLEKTAATEAGKSDAVKSKVVRVSAKEKETPGVRLITETDAKENAPPSRGAKSNAGKEGKGEALREASGQETLDVALDLLSQSRIFWEKGDVDNALKSLDEAYALILEVNGDPDLSRQKDDLRLMISKMIVQVCASRHTVTTGKQSEIPMIMNADVEKEIRSFQTVERGFFLRSYHRAGMYLPSIQKNLKEAGLPKELAWLPLVESGFQVSVLSRARALGLWQFIPSTGYKYALKRDQWVDERMDVEKSTKAAIAYMKELHDIFGDWLTVLAAYNCGEGKVLRVISKQHINYLDRFWDLYRQLPQETARYVPRFLATLHIIRDPKKYGMDLSENPEKPIPYEIVKTNKCMRIEDIADKMNVQVEILQMLNSELRLKMTPDSVYNLKVPSGTGVQFAKVADEIPRWEPPPPRRLASKYIKHRVRAGETVGSIAKRYHLSKQDILAVNKVSAKRPLKVGQRIKIPVEKDQDVPVKLAKKRGGKPVVRAAVAEEFVKYRVKRGDTLASIAAKHNTTVSELKKINGLTRSKVQTDQIVIIKSNKMARKGS